MAEEVDDIEVVETEATEAEATEQTAAPDGVADLAREMGWRPKDEWSGDEAAWVDERTFIKNTRDINRTLSRDLKDLKKQMDGIGRATSQMTARAVQQERDRLEALHEQAVDDGDKVAAKQAVDAISKLPTPQADIPAETQSFVEKHSSWWNKDAEATAYAIKRAGKYADEGLTPARQLAAVERDMKKHFPDLIKDAEPAPRKAPPSLGSPQRAATPTPREKGYSTLPPDARKACDEWIADQKEQGNSWASKDAWAKSYYGQEATNG